MRLGTDTPHARVFSSLALALTIAAGTARAEYRAPSLPELSRFQAVAPQAPAPRTAADFLAEARRNPAIAAKLAQAQAAAQGFKPVGNTAFTDVHPAAPSAPAQAREAALESLQTKKRLDEELAKVRQMLAATDPQPVVEAAPVAVATPEPVPVAPVVQPNTINRLLTTVGGGDRQREELAARIQVVKDNLSKKDARYQKLSNSSGGTLFQASLEFNRSARGSTPQMRGKSFPSNRRTLEKELADVESATRGDSRPVASRSVTLGFAADAIQPMRPGEVPEALLMRHRPAYEDSTIKEDGRNQRSASAAPKPAGELDLGGTSRHRTEYASSGIGAFEESKGQ